MTAAIARFEELSKVSVAHGEASAADTLRHRIRHELGWPAAVPPPGSSVTVGAPRPTRANRRRHHHGQPNQCARRHQRLRRPARPRVWLFMGLGGPGALSDEAVQLCHDKGIDVVAGACPLMFLEFVGWSHKLHRMARHLNGSLSRSAWEAPTGGARVKASAMSPHKEGPLARVAVLFQGKPSHEAQPRPTDERRVLTAG